MIGKGKKMHITFWKILTGRFSFVWVHYLPVLETKVVLGTPGDMLDHRRHIAADDPLCLPNLE